MEEFTSISGSAVGRLGRLAVLNAMNCAGHQREATDRQRIRGGKSHSKQPDPREVGAFTRREITRQRYRQAAPGQGTGQTGGQEIMVDDI